jgi:hypothetical protein
MENAQEGYALCRVFKKSGPGRRIGIQYSALVSCNKNMLLSVEEQSEEEPSPLSHGEEEDQTNSRETSSEIINDTNVDDGVSKRGLQSASYESASCNFTSLNESISHPKVSEPCFSLQEIVVTGFFLVNFF